MKDLLTANIASSIQTENVEISDTSHMTVTHENCKQTKFGFSIEDNLKKAENLVSYWKSVRKEKLLFGKYTATDWQSVNKCLALAERTVAKIMNL